MQKNRTWIRLTAVFLAVFSVLFLAACTTKETGKKWKVAVISKSTTSAFWKSVYSGSNAAASAYNIDLLFEGPEKEDYETQNKMIEQAVEDGYDAIVFSAVDHRNNVAAVESAVEQGIRIIGIDSDVDSDKLSCRIGTDNYNAGCVAGEAILKSKDEFLNIGIVNFEKNTLNGQERERGFSETVSGNERVRIVDTINVDSDVKDAKRKTGKLLEEHPEINAIVTFNEWTSLGVGYAIREKKLWDKVYVVAFDSNVVSVGMLETGEVDALVVQNPYAMGYLGVEVACHLLNGLGVESEQIDTETICVTKENMYEDECQKLLFAFE